MLLFDIFYNILIYPIEFILETFFYLYKNVFYFNNVLSLFLLSISINLLLIPIYNIAEKWQKEEQDIQNKMKPEIDHIKSTFRGDERFLLIRACYKIHKYRMFYSFRSVFGILIQIPFFLAAYRFVSDLNDLNMASFLFIKDFSQPDALLKLGSFNINVLPLIMTFISLLSSFAFIRNKSFKENINILITPLLFLILLYNSVSGLLFYYTINSIFSLLKNILKNIHIFSIVIECCNIIKKSRVIIFKAYNVMFILLTIILISLIILGTIERKGYIQLDDANLVDVNSYNVKMNYYSSVFKHSDLYGIKVNTNNIDKTNISSIYFLDKGSPFGYIVFENEPTEKELYLYYRLFIKTYIIFLYFFLLLLELFIIFREKIKNIIPFNIIAGRIKNIFTSISIFVKKIVFISNNRNKLFIISSLVLTILSGLFIPCSLIGSSISEFDNQLSLIFNSFSMSIGLFFVYPMILYFIYGSKVKNVLSILFVFLVLYSIINTFIMVGNYERITSDFVFDNTSLLDISNNIFYINIITIVVILFLVIYSLKYNRVIINLYLIVLVSLSLLSIINIAKIYNFVKQEQTKEVVQYDSLFNLSKKGNNIFVFILDMSLSPYWVSAIERYPEYQEQLDGFQFFVNSVSLGSSTASSLSIEGGYEYIPYEISTNGNYNIAKKHSEALLMLPLSLEKYGYKSSILSPFSFEGLNIFTPYSNFIFYAYEKNIKLDNLYKYYGISEKDVNNVKMKLKYNKLIRFSLFRMSPNFIRPYIYQNNKWFINVKEIYSFSMKQYYYLNEVPNNTIINNDDVNYYNYFHSKITHVPYFFDEEGLPTLNYTSVDLGDFKIYSNIYNIRQFYSSKAAINSIINFIDFLKENDVYDNTKIILVSDHANAVNPLPLIISNDKVNYNHIMVFNNILLLKDYNAKGKLKIKTNFMSNADVPYLATKHIPNIQNYFTGKIITNDYKKNGLNVIYNHFADYGQYSNSYRFNQYFYVKDDIFDTNNWKLFKIDWNTKQSKELGLYDFELGDY